jgi:hypothetical protein
MPVVTGKYAKKYREKTGCFIGNNNLILSGNYPKYRIN